MPRRRTVAPVALAIALSAVLAGCVQQPEHVIPTSPPTSKPVFASDAAALAAAKKAYVGYLAASDLVAHDGGDQVALLKPWVTAAQYKRDAKSLAQMKAEGHHTTGNSTFSNVSLESYEQSGAKATVVTYICLQIGATELLDSSGQNVGADRPLSLPLEVTFVNAGNNSPKLLVDGSVGWSGTDFCS